ncbi:MAG: condensation domain-containing protein [Micromonosporaceae bacterium]
MTVNCVASGRHPLTYQQWARLERERQARDAGDTLRTNLISEEHDLVGDLNPRAFRNAARQITRRHPALRAAFLGDQVNVCPCDLSDAGVQVSDDVAGPGFPADRHSRARLQLRRIGPRKHRVALSADHLVFDGHSSRVFWRDFWAAYTAGHDPAPQAAAGCRCQPAFLEFIHHQAEQRRSLSPGLREAISILEERDSPLGYVELPVRLELSQVGSRAVATHTYPLPDSFGETLREYARSRRTTPFVVIATAVFAALHRLTGAARPMVYTYLRNRRTSAERDAIGWFSATVLLLGAVTSDQTLAAALGAAKSVLARAQVSGAVATELLHRERDAGNRHAVLPSVSLSLADEEPEPLTADGLVIQRRHDVETPATWLPRGRIAIEVSRARVEVSHEVERFSPATVAALAETFTTTLQEITRDEGARVGR